MNILSIRVLDLPCDLVGFVMIGVKHEEIFMFKNCSDNKLFLS